MRTYGTIDFVKGKWVIEAEPHVVLRIKRCFPRVSRKSHGKITLAASLEIARDLEWFRERYPLKCKSKQVEEHLVRAAKANRDNEDMVERLLAGKLKPRAFDLALPPRDYQKIAAEMVLTSGGLLLADDVGLGKTCMAIAMISDPRARPALVVTLAHLPTQWEAECRKFAPQLRTHILKTSAPYDLTASGKNPKQLSLEPELPDVIISSYRKLSGWAGVLAPLIKSVTYDEVQELRKGTETNKGAAAEHISQAAHFRLGLSATPIYNYGGEIWHVLEALRPGALGTIGEFKEEWCGGGGESIADPKAFGSYARDAGLMLRRTREDVGRELPEITHIPHHVECDMDHLKDVESAAMSLARVILSQNETVQGEKFRAAEELSSLVRQATGVAKAPYVAEFVRLLVESGENVVLYGWHREVYGIWNERLASLNPVMYTGTESPTQKAAAKERFLSGQSKVLIMSLRSGAGLDGLQANGRCVVFGELDWSPGVHEQCIGRRARDGQTDNVLAYYLIADSGSDPIVADVLGVKKTQIAGLRDPHHDLVEKLDTGGGHIKKLAEHYLQTRGRAA